MTITPDGMLNLRAEDRACSRSLKSGRSIDFAAAHGNKNASVKPLNSFISSLQNVSDLSVGTKAACLRKK